MLSQSCPRIKRSQVSRIKRIPRFTDVLSNKSFAEVFARRGRRGLEEEWAGEEEGTGERQGHKDLETVKRDKEYELFFLKKEDGRPFFNREL